MRSPSLRCDSGNKSEESKSPRRHREQKSKSLAINKGQAAPIEILESLREVVRSIEKFSEYACKGRSACNRHDSR